MSTTTQGPISFMGYYLFSGRVGTRGEYWAWAERPDGTQAYTSPRVSGKGAREKAMDYVRDKIKTELGGLEES